MKKLLLLLLALNTLASSVQIPYTLENLKNLNIYYVDKSGLFSKMEQDKIKTSIKNKLQKHGFNLQAEDPSTLVISIKTIDIDDTIVANVVILVGEEVITKRDGKIETMALSFYLNNFIELDEPTLDIKDAINSLLGEFLKLYKEDME